MTASPPNPRRVPKNAAGGNSHIVQIASGGGVKTTSGSPSVRGKQVDTRTCEWGGGVHQLRAG